MKTSNAMNSDGLHFIWVLEKDRSAYLHVYKSLQKATSDLNTFSKIKRGSIDPSIGRTGSMGISQIGHGIGNSKMTIDDIASSVEKKYGVEPEVIRHDVANNPVKQTQKEFMNKQELVKLRFQLITAVTDYDRKDSTKRNYNIYALPQYFQRVDSILSDVEAGADPRSAIVAGFIGTLRNFVLRKLKMSGSSTEEDRGGGSMYYKPVAKRNPVRQRKGWKIQTGSGGGWSDIKFSSGSDFYRTQYFKTKPDAQSELNQLAGIHGDPESYRIVPAATEEDFDLYNPVHRKNPVRQRIAVSLSKSRRNPFNDRNLDA